MLNGQTGHVVGATFALVTLFGNAITRAEHEKQVNRPLAILTEQAPAPRLLRIDERLMRECTLYPENSYRCTQSRLIIAWAQSDSVVMNGRAFQPTYSLYPLASSDDVRAGLGALMLTGALKP